MGVALTGSTSQSPWLLKCTEGSSFGGSVRRGPGQREQRMSLLQTHGCWLDIPMEMSRKKHSGSLLGPGEGLEANHWEEINEAIKVYPEITQGVQGTGEGVAGRALGAAEAEDLEKQETPLKGIQERPLRKQMWPCISDPPSQGFTPTFPILLAFSVFFTQHLPPDTIYFSYLC